MLTNHPRNLFKVLSHTCTPAQRSGTAEIELDGKIRTLRAYMLRDDSIDIYGLAVRIGFSGTKVWRGDATYWLTNGVLNSLRASARDRMNQRGIRFLGIYEEVTEAAKSKATGN